MADLNFPSSPVNGQQYSLNGVIYTYSSTVGAWLTTLVQSQQVSNTTNTQIIFNDAGVSNGSPGLVFDRQANVFTTNTAVITGNTTSKYFIGDGSQVSNLNLSLAYAYTNNYIGPAANITANLILSNTLITNSIYNYSNAVVQNYTNAIWQIANNAANTANNAGLTSNGAFTVANNAGVTANNAGVTSNGAFTVANNAGNTANAYIANTSNIAANLILSNVYFTNTVNTAVLNYLTTSPGVYSTTNAAFNTANGITNGTISIANVSLTGNINPGTVNVTSQTLSDASGTINWNMATGPVATVTLTGTGRTVAAPTNLKVGTIILHIYQDGTGGRTITTWNSVFKWTAGVAWVATNTSPNAHDVLSFVSDGTNLYGSYLPDMR